MLADENKQDNFSLDNEICNGLQCNAMANKKTTTKESNVGRPIQLRANKQDFAIIQAGMRKHGLDMSQILRMALRRFAEAEALKVS
jgi:hypothetical protein